MREVAAVLQCQSNLKQIVLGLHDYHDTNGTFPPAVMSHPDLPLEQRLSWQAAILPYLEQDVVYLRLKKDEAWDSEANGEVAQTLLKCYLCLGMPARPARAREH